MTYVLECCIPQGYFYPGGGAEGALPPLHFDNPKRSKIWYVARGAISRRVAAAKCKSAAIDFWIFFKTFFGCFVRYLDLWATRHTERSTIFSKGPTFVKKVPKSQMPPPPLWRFDEKFPVPYLHGPLVRLGDIGFGYSQYTRITMRCVVGLVKRSLRHYISVYYVSGPLVIYIKKTGLTAGIWLASTEGIYIYAYTHTQRSKEDLFYNKKRPPI